MELIDFYYEVIDLERWQWCMRIFRMYLQYLAQATSRLNSHHKNPAGDLLERTNLPTIAPSFAPCTNPTMAF